jgi:hypothetical protein
LVIKAAKGLLTKKKTKKKPLSSRPSEASFPIWAIYMGLILCVFL